MTRNAGAMIFIPSESEWYKAAYYNPGTSSYYQYPFSSSTVPTSAMPGSTPNTGNFTAPNGNFAVTGSTSFSSSQNYLTDVGAYTASASPYGAFDMGGNVIQWNEGLPGGSIRGLRGGAWSFGALVLNWSVQDDDFPSVEFDDIGFRVASLVPEPSSAMLAGLGFGGFAAWAWRRRKRLGPS